MTDFIFYLKLGWEHIISLDALDHQLFILVLVITFHLSAFKKLLILVTAFTLGHSITLALSVLNIVQFPSDWVEFFIPITIAITALENVFFINKNKFSHQLKYISALFFGLIHGMGFANSVKLMIAQEQSLVVPLLGFNFGLELGQILVVVLVLCLNGFIRKIINIKMSYWSSGISLLILFFSIKMAWERFPY